MSNPQENVTPVEQPNIQPEPAVNTAPELEIVELPQEDSQQQEPVAEQPKQFDPKTDKVDFSTPEQQEKFNYIYKQMKQSDTRNAMLTEMLENATKSIEELKARFQQTDAADAERILMGKIKAARESGDDAAEIAALNELVDFKADKKINAVKPVEKQVTVPQDNTQKYLASYIGESDATGQVIRPWAQDGHPDQEYAIQALETIKPKYLNDPYGLPKALLELDQIMKAKMTQKPTSSPPQQRAPNPMQGGNLTNAPQKNTIKLTRQEVEIAKKLGITPQRYAAKRDELNGRK